MEPPHSDAKGKTKFRVAICGGGVAGLCLANALSKYLDIKVDLYEAAARFTEVGAGLTVWSRIWTVLSLMGMGTTLRNVAAASPSEAFEMYVRRSDQPTEGFQFLTIELPYTAVHFHRAHFVDAVVEHHLPKDIAHFGKRLTSYSQSGQLGPITLQFADGSSANCDLLVGCDGIKSVVRHAMMEKKVVEGLPDFSKYMEPVWTGSIAYRVLVPVDRLPNFIREDPQLTKPLTYCGKDKHIMRYCISQGTTLNVVAFVSQPELSDTVYNGPWATECDSTELIDAHSNWEPRVSENVALVGDAAHAMAPHQGSGAGQAIEDAYILANLLGHPFTTLDTLSHTLKAYEHVRLPLANNVRTTSRNTGPMFEFKSSSGDDYKAIKATMEQQWDWMSADGVEEQLQKALSKMMEALN